VWLDGAERLALMRTSYRRDEPYLWVAQGEPRKLPARVPRRANDRDACRHNEELCVDMDIYAKAG
jgi:hypothetical protein